MQSDLSFKSYPSDLSEEQWLLISPLLVFGTGRPPKIERRRVLNAIFYVMHTGCQWRALPHDFPDWSTVYSCFHRWSWNGVLDTIHAALRDQVRAGAGKDEPPTAGSVDSQSVKSVSKGGTRACFNAATTAPSGSVGASGSCWPTPWGA